MSQPSFDQSLDAGIGNPTDAGQGPDAAHAKLLQPFLKMADQAGAVAPAEAATAAGKVQQDAAQAAKEEFSGNDPASNELYDIAYRRNLHVADPDDLDQFPDITEPEKIKLATARADAEVETFRADQKEALKPLALKEELYELNAENIEAERGEFGPLETARYERKQAEVRNQNLAGKSTGSYWGGEEVPQKYVDLEMQRLMFVDGYGKDLSLAEKTDLATAEATAFHPGSDWSVKKARILEKQSIMYDIDAGPDLSPDDKKWLEQYQR